MTGTWANFASGLRNARSRLEDFQRDENGATAIEYGLLCALLFLAVVSAVRAFTASASDMYINISDTLLSTAP